MKYITENGIIQDNINIETINFYLSMGFLIAKIEDNRKLEYKSVFLGNKEIQGDFINNLSEEELENGLNEVEKVCKKARNFALLEKYYLKALKDDSLLNKIKQLKIYQLNLIFDEKVSLLKKEYIPYEERLSWEQQERESRAFKANNYENEELYPTIKLLAEIRQYNIKELANKIIDKADNYRKKIFFLIGKRQNLQDIIDKADNLDILNEIEINFNEEKS